MSHSPTIPPRCALCGSSLHTTHDHEHFRVVALQEFHALGARSDATALDALTRALER